MLRSFLWVILGNLARQASFLIVNAFLFQRLSRSVFGALALAFAYMSIFAGLGEFGLRQLGWREIARDAARARSIAGSFLSARMFTAAAAMAVYVLMMPLLWRSGAPPAIYLLYGLGIAFNGGTFDFPLFGLSRIDLFAKFSAIVYAAYLLACFVLVSDDAHAWRVPGLFVTSMALLLVLELVWFRSTLGAVRLRLAPRELGRKLRMSWALGLGEVLNRLALTYPLLLIGLLVGSEGVGNYRIAELGYSFLAQFGQMFAASGFSRLSQKFQHRPSALRGTLAWMSAATISAALLAGLLFSIVAPHIFQLVFGSVAPETIEVLRLLGIALVFSAPARFLRSLLPSIDRQHLLLPVNATGMLTGVVVGWLAISRYGIAGMATAVIFAELTTLLLLAAIYLRSLQRSASSTA